MLGNPFRLITIVCWIYRLGPAWLGRRCSNRSRQIEGMIRGLTDAAQRLGSHQLYSHCRDWVWAQQPCKTAHTQFAEVTRKWERKRKCLQHRFSPSLLVLGRHKSTKQFCRIHSWGSKVGCSFNPPFAFSPEENGFSRSFEKLSTVQLTCSEGALFSNTW